MKRSTYDSVLGMVNGQRSVRGLLPLKRLPSGRPASQCECPIARSLPNAMVTTNDHHNYTLQWGGWREGYGLDSGPIPLSAEVREFIREVDAQPRTADVDPLSLVDAGAAS